MESVCAFELGSNGKCEKHSPSARASPQFSRVLQNSRVLI